MFITLKHDATCADCGAVLAAGTRARFYRNGTIYGDECHRWQVEIGKAKVKTLQAAIDRVKSACRGREIPEDAASLLLQLKSAHGQRITKENFKQLVGDLDRAARMIEESL